jgi:hypothetical protein
MFWAQTKNGHPNLGVTPDRYWYSLFWREKRREERRMLIGEECCRPTERWDAVLLVEAAGVRHVI